VQAGHSQLTLETELADKPVLPNPANFITHADQSSSVDTVVPEFSTVFAIVVFLTLATGALVYSKKHTKKNTTLASPATRL